MAWLDSWLSIFLFASLPFVFLLFPNGKLLSSRWRLVAWLLLGAITLSAVSVAFMPGPFEDYPVVTNPFGIAFAGRALKLLRMAVEPLVLVAAIASILKTIPRRAGGSKVAGIGETVPSGTPRVSPTAPPEMPFFQQSKAGHR
jgi:hypothetical protein